MKQKAAKAAPKARPLPPPQAAPRKRALGDVQQMVPLLVIAAAVGLLAAGLQGKKAEKVSMNTPEVQQKVSKHLELTAQQLEIQRRRLAIENSKMIMDYSQSEPESAFAPQKEGVELMTDQTAEQVARDIGRRQADPTQMPNTPADLIHHQLFQEQQNREQSEAYKKEYARQFIENARRGGWDIKLNDEYRVISVKPIRHAAPTTRLFHDQ